MRPTNKTPRADFTSYSHVPHEVSFMTSAMRDYKWWTMDRAESREFLCNFSANNFYVINQKVVCQLGRYAHVHVEVSSLNLSHIMRHSDVCIQPINWHDAEVCCCSPRMCPCSTRAKTRYTYARRMTHLAQADAFWWISAKWVLGYGGSIPDQLLYF